jgi:hypothetical protein
MCLRAALTSAFFTTTFTVAGFASATDTTPGCVRAAAAGACPECGLPAVGVRPFTREAVWCAGAGGHVWAGERPLAGRRRRGRTGPASGRPPGRKSRT